MNVITALSIAVLAIATLDPARACWETDDADHFGPIEVHTRCGSVLAADEDVAFELHWLEAGYTQYDIEQSLMFMLANQRVAAGRLRLLDHEIDLVGRRSGYEVVLVDVALLLSGRRYDDHWFDLVEHLKGNNLAGGASADGQIVLSLDADAQKRVRVIVSQSVAPNLPSNNIVEAIAECEGHPQTWRTWIGEFDQSEGDMVDIRIVSFTGAPCGADRTPAFGAYTVRSQRRALEDPVPTGCLWKSRTAFARTLHEINRAGVAWYRGEFNEQAQEVIAFHLGGRKMTRSEFFEQIETTFGSIRAANQAVCPIPEVLHVAIVGWTAGSDGEFTGLAWFEDPEPTPKRFITRVMRARLGSEDGKLRGDLFVSHLPWPDNSSEAHFAEMSFDIHSFEDGSHP